MIKTEFYMRRDDGVELYRTYSTKGHYIRRDKELYEEAIDPAGTDRVYTETRTPIPGWVAPEEPEEAEPKEE